MTHNSESVQEKKKIVFLVQEQKKRIKKSSSTLESRKAKGKYWMRIPNHGKYHHIFTLQKILENLNVFDFGQKKNQIDLSNRNLGNYKNKNKGIKIFK